MTWMRSRTQIKEHPFPSLLPWLQIPPSLALPGKIVSPPSPAHLTPYRPSFLGMALPSSYSLKMLPIEMFGCNPRSSTMVQRVHWPTSCVISDLLYLPSTNRKAFLYSARTGKHKESNSVCPSPCPRPLEFTLIVKTVTDYGDENPLLMDYYNFDPELYKLKFSSRGDATLSKRVVELFQKVLLLRPHSFCSRRPSHTPLSFCRLVLALVRPQRTKPVVSMDEGSRDQAWTTVSSLHSSSCSAKNSAACPSCKLRLTGH